MSKTSLKSWYDIPDKQSAKMRIPNLDLIE